MSVKNSQKQLKPELELELPEVLPRTMSANFPERYNTECAPFYYICISAAY